MDQILMTQFLQLHEHILWRRITVVNNLQWHTLFQFNNSAIISLYKKKLLAGTKKIALAAIGNMADEHCIGNFTLMPDITINITICIHIHCMYTQQWYAIKDYVNWLFNCRKHREIPHAATSYSNNINQRKKNIGTIL